MAASVGVAFVVGIVVSTIVNHDLLHRALRKVRMTRESSHPSEWYSAFAEYSDCYVVLHLVGERRLYGWAKEWTGSPDRGYIRVVHGEWLDDDGPQIAGEAVVVPAKDVEMVEFVKQEPSQ